MTGLPFHPLANIFPLIEGAEFDELVADMRAHGFRQGEEIVLFEGQILDGRNRYRAAIAAGIFPEDADPKTRWEFMEFSTDGVDGCFTEVEITAGPLAYVISKNLHRRHLNESQRAYVAAQLANLGHGGPRHGDQAANLPLETSGAQVSQEEAARLLNVSERSVRSAKAVQERGTPEIQHAVAQGRMPVSQAAIAVRLAQGTQRQIADEAMAGRPNVVRTVIKKEARDARERDLGSRQRALPDKQYGVIYADPEWRFEPYSRDSGLDRAADNHYPTSATLDIIARPVGKIAAKDCVLFLWATAPMLPQALAVMKGWGFDYKTHRVWNKIRSGDGRGSGYWFTGEHELLLVGTRGNIPAPATAVGKSVVDAPWQDRHSAKPEVFAVMIEQLYPNLPKIELNARAARPGWDVWGNEAPDPIDAHANEHGIVRVSDSHSVAKDYLTPDERTEVLARSAAEEDDGLDIPDFLRRSA